MPTLELEQQMASESLAAVRRPRSTTAWGVVFGLLAALGYTATNTFLRAVADCDPIWVSAVKAIPTVAVLGPWLVWRRWRGERVWPGRRVVAALLLAGLIGQLMGNILFQWCLGVIGVALATPLVLGVIIVGGAVMGRVWLHEPVTARSAAALGLLLAAIVLLSLGAGDAHRSVAASGTGSPLGAAWPPWVLLGGGLAAAILAGLAYAILTVVIRYGVRGEASVAVSMFVIGAVGLVTLGPLSYARLGLAGLAATEPGDLGLMAVAGLCNFLAFLAMTRALQLATVVLVNALGASQVAMAAVVGVVLFGEAATAAMVAGVALTALGLALMEEGHRADEPQASEDGPERQRRRFPAD